MLSRYDPDFFNTIRRQQPPLNFTPLSRRALSLLYEKESKTRAVGFFVDEGPDIVEFVVNILRRDTRADISGAGAVLVLRLC